MNLSGFSSFCRKMIPIPKKKKMEKFEMNRFVHRFERSPSFVGLVQNTFHSRKSTISTRKPSKFIPNAYVN